MPVFRRNSAGDANGKAQDSEAEQSQEAPAKSRPSAQAGKGRPTPKRSEAERGRYQTITGSTTSGRGPSSGTAPRRGGKATPEEKARARAERVRRMEAMRRGDDWALLPRDRGPIRKLARDYVDAKRRPSEYYMYVLVVLLVALLSRNTTLSAYMTYVVLLLIVIVAVDAFRIRRALRGLAAERFPSESTRGMTTYAVMRALQIRRFRNPTPRLKPGDKY